MFHCLYFFCCSVVVVLGKYFLVFLLNLFLSLCVKVVFCIYQILVFSVYLVFSL